MGLRMSGSIAYSSKNKNMGPAFGPVVSYSSFVKLFC
jgi:hypothetical protein